MSKFETGTNHACPHAYALRGRDGTIECSKCGKTWQSLQAYVDSKAEPGQKAKASEYQDDEEELRVRAIEWLMRNQLH